MDETDTSTAVGSFESFMAAAWQAAGIWLPMLLQRYGLLFVFATGVAWGGTYGLKLLLRAWVMHRYGTRTRPWWYRGVLFWTSVILGTWAGVAVGALDSALVSVAEGGLTGMFAGFVNTVVVRATKSFLRKRGIDIESTSDDLTLQPMKAVRRERSDLPTDPVVVDSGVPSDPADKITDKP